MKNNICSLVALTFFMTGMSGVCVGVFVSSVDEQTLQSLHAILIGVH